MNFYERLFSRNEVKVFPGGKMIKFLTLITFLAITIVACLRSWWFFNLFFFFVCEIQPRPLVSLGRKTHKKNCQLRRLNTREKRPQLRPQGSLLSCAGKFDPRR